MKDALPLTLISPRDRHLPACRGEKGKFMCANSSGTFAVGVLAEPGCHSSGPRRALLELASWPLLVADDLTMIILHGMTCESVLLCPDLPPDHAVSALVEEASQRRNLAVGGM